MTRLLRQLEKARDDHAAAEVAYNKAKVRLDACAAIVKAYEAHPDAPRMEAQGPEFALPPAVLRMGGQASSHLGTEEEQLAAGRKVVVLDESK